MNGSAVAERDWYLRARVRVVAAMRTSAGRGLVVRPPRYWRIGEEAELFQWGRAGRPVDHDDWWTTRDTDTAYILPAAAVGGLEILDGTQDQQAAVGRDRLVVRQGIHDQQSDLHDPAGGDSRRR
ncbi:hypothetical protein [Microlunatus speluncae]|uniref:hypothetical protein n=1 Tax=Microlunatus speluncae TaxID=2594267 RepID=UPI0012660FF1|nr:hypothetical protein [Microlunatus speluncae]